VTVGCAVLVFVLITDFPEEARWLSKNEKDFVKARLADDIGDSQLHVQITLRDVLGVFKDPKIFLGGPMYFGFVVLGDSYTYFAPTIIRSLGYSPVKTQLCSVPPWAVTFALSMIAAAASDYCNRRYILILPMLLVSAVGEIILLNVHNDMNARYGALFLVVLGGYTAAPIIVCWFGANRERKSMHSHNHII